MATPERRASELLRQALRQLKKGEADQGEQALRQRVQEYLANPPDPGTLAEAHNELGIFYTLTNRDADAVECYICACAVPPADAAGRRDRAKYLLHLGNALEELGRNDEAEAVYREGLEQREELYGRLQPGYAFGLEPLAALLLKLGRAGEAVPLIDEAVLNYRRVAHKRFSYALALQAAVWSSAGKSGSAFAVLTDLPDAWVAQGATAVAEVAGQWEPPLAHAVVTDVLQLAEKRLEPGNPAMLGLWTTLANLDGRLGHTLDRKSVLQKLVGAHDKTGDTEKAVQALLALALAQGEDKQAAQALASYRDATARADRLDKPELQAQVLRNFGVFLIEQQQLDEAETRLRAALAAAARGKDAVLSARCQVALAALLADLARFPEARPLLDAALPVIPANHPDAETCRLYHDRLGPAEAVPELTPEQRFQQYVLEKLPPGLIRTFGVTRSKEEGIGLQVHLAREPVQQEQALLERTIREALELFRDQLK